MLLPMLINMAINHGAILIEETQKDVRLVTKKLGVTIVLAKLSKEAIYQMSRTPDMPATLAEAVNQVKASEEKVLADEPVPLPVPRPARRKPQLSVVQGGRV